MGAPKILWGPLRLVMNDPSLVVAGLPAAATPLSLSNAQQLLPPPMVAGPQQLVSGRRAHSNNLGPGG